MQDDMTITRSSPHEAAMLLLKSLVNGWEPRLTGSPERTARIDRCFRCGQVQQEVNRHSAWELVAEDSSFLTSVARGLCFFCLCVHIFSTICVLSFLRVFPFCPD